MPDFLKTSFADGPPVQPLAIFVRLLLALGLGCLVAWIYSKTRGNKAVTPSFPVTLVLLSILIAMVTQVIGDNVARAFSLVGALSIVRFRTVVRDTQDTAYVIFAVVVGMAVGAQNPLVAFEGLGIIGLAAFAMSFQSKRISDPDGVFVLKIRTGISSNTNGPLTSVLDGYLHSRRLVSTGTAKQGMSLDLAYEVQLRSADQADELVRALNKVEGVQSVELERNELERN
jgi:hypothetical protein